MGLMQRAYETYEALAPKYAGIYDETQKEVFAPISHIVTKAEIEITIDLEGNFHSARSIGKDEGKIIIPVTEDSAGRTSKPVAHPLCEQVGYLCCQDAEKYCLYVQQLNDWINSSYSHPILEAVLQYVNKKTILEDLKEANLLKIDNGKIKNEKSLVKWIVLGCEEPDCTKNKKIFSLFISYYREKMNSCAQDFCMLEGVRGRISNQHPKGIVAFNGNAKLVSANDGSGFTYRGRFFDDNQAVSISYDASQKAHSALRWLIANQGVSFGSRVFVCWNPDGIKLPDINNSFLFAAEPLVKYSDYQLNLQKTLIGWKTNMPMDSKAIIAAFDAATTGRLALTYYNELLASDFLNRLYAWDESCCWFNGSFGIQSPALYNIILYAFGNRRDENKIECDDRIVKQQMQRLIACRIEKAMMPFDIERALVYRCGNLQLYEKGLREKILFTACAVIKKYHMDKAKEEWNLALEPNKKDRSYQFGRLLAIMEKAERDTYDRDEKREPNAIRLQPMFVQQPMKTSKTIIEQLKKAYFPRLNPGGRIFYDRLIAEIMNEISETNENWDAPLEDTYIMGYYLQKRELYQSKDKEDKQ